MPGQTADACGGEGSDGGTSTGWGATRSASGLGTAGVAASDTAEPVSGTGSGRDGIGGIVVEAEGIPGGFGLTLGTKGAPVDLDEVACDVAKPASDTCGAAGWPVVVGMVAGDVAKPGGSERELVVLVDDLRQ